MVMNGFKFVDVLRWSRSPFGAGLWIRIRMDPHSFFLLDPDPGGKKQKKWRKLEKNCNYIIKY